MDGPIDGRPDQYALMANGVHLLMCAFSQAHSNPTAAVISQRLPGDDKPPPLRGSYTTHLDAIRGDLINNLTQ